MTDYQALDYALKKKYVHGRLARGRLASGLELIAEYEFHIIYRLDAVNSPADYLSSYGEDEKERDRFIKVLNVHD